jgi:alanine-glyoxylate transaminase / (R)-3-amino-2-methylpropionate-pyruvate transaminase|tara:strand:- start:286 stop:744 length:459 start_codon:yes stop_codon:yes gene_type:complete
MGNGFPLAAVATTKEIASSIGSKLTFSTYGANPIAMAAGREVLKVVDDEKLQENSLEMGNLFLKGLKELSAKYDQIGDIRGQGLMIGAEIVTDKESKTPNAELLNKVYEKTKDYGILLGKGGRHGNVFRVQPPMCLNAEDVWFALDVIDRSF